MRALKWRLHLAVGAWARARKEVDHLKERVDSTASLSRALVVSQRELEETRKVLTAERERASQLAMQVNELQGFREQSDKASLELSQTRAEHEDKVKAMQRFFDKRWDQLKASHAEDKSNWDKRLEEEELKCRRQQDQLTRLDKELAEMKDRLKRSDERAARLSDELDYAHQEIGDRQSRVDELKESLRQNQSAKSKALNRVQVLGDELARRDEQVNKMSLEFQERLKAFGEEAASRHRRISELEKQLAEANTRASSAVEEYKSSTQFAEERRAACADAFRFGEEEARAKITQAYPDLDLSCLEAEYYETRTPGAEEDEYEEISDVDLEAVLGIDAAAEVSRRDSIEKGEPSDAPADAAAGGAGSDPKP